MRSVDLYVWTCAQILIGLSCLTIGAHPAAAAPIALSAPTTDWTDVGYASLIPDFSDDQQTGIGEADIVGDATNPALYMHFDDAGTPSTTDGSLAFRVRLGQDKNPPGFTQFFGIGIDANLDGAIDLFLGVDNVGNGDEIGIYDAGSGANTSPSTTTIVSAAVTSYPETIANYDFSAVDGTIDPLASSFDLDADGKTDQFLSFLVSFQDIVDALTAQGIAGFEDNSPFQLVAGTSTQNNALNQDLGGPDGGTTSTQTWEDLGALSTVLIPIAAMPEPSTGALLSLGLVGIAALRRRAGR